MTTINAANFGTGAVNTVLTGNGVGNAPTFQTLPASLFGRNLIFNGDFQVWQRGAGGSATFAITGSGAAIQYGPDRWQIGNVGASTAMTFSQQPGPTSGSFVLRVQRNNGTNGLGTPAAVQGCTRDMCIGMQGQKVTLSFTAKAGANFSAASSILTVGVNTGTNSSDISNFTTIYSGLANVISGSQAITTTATRYTLTSSGVVSASATLIDVEFSYQAVGTAGAADYFEISDVQLEFGTAATPYQRLSFTEELQRCLRFYWKSFVYATAPAQNIGAGTSELIVIANKIGAVLNIFYSMLFPVQLRITPTITFYSPGAASAQAYDESASAACTGTTQNNSSQNSLDFYCTGNASTIIGNLIAVHATAEADIT